MHAGCVDERALLRAIEDIMCDEDPLPRRPVLGRLRTYVTYFLVLLKLRVDCSAALASSESAARPWQTSDGGADCAVCSRVLDIDMAMAFVATVLLSSVVGVASLGRPSYIETTCSPGCFTVASTEAVATIYVDDSREPAGVLRAASDLRSDVHRVTTQTPVLVNNATAIGRAAPTIIVGTLGRSTLLAELIARGKFDPAPLAGAWEAFVIQTVAHPLRTSLEVEGAFRLLPYYFLYIWAYTLIARVIRVSDPGTRSPY